MCPTPSRTSRALPKPDGDRQRAGQSTLDSTSRTKPTAIPDDVDFIEGNQDFGDQRTDRERKTSLVLDLALHIALGRKWRGRSVEKGGVIYTSLRALAPFGNATRRGAKSTALATVFRLRSLMVAFDAEPRRRRCPHSFREGGSGPLGCARSGSSSICPRARCTTPIFLPGILPMMCSRRIEVLPPAYEIGHPDTGNCVVSVRCVSKSFYTPPRLVHHHPAVWVECLAGKAIARGPNQK